MKTTSWDFDENPHRTVQSGLRKWVEDELHYFSIGRFVAGSERERRLVLLAQALDQYSVLFNQVVTEQLIDSVTRRANRGLLKENESLLTENKQLVMENKFLCKEATHYKLTLDDERRTANKFFSWAPNYIIARMKGASSS